MPPVLVLAIRASSLEVIVDNEQGLIVERTIAPLTRRRALGASFSQGAGSPVEPMKTAGIVSSPTSHSLTLLVLMISVAFAAEAPERQVRSMDIPHYPPLAYQARIQGTVVLRVFVTAEGQVERVEVASGHLLLGASSADNARSLHFKPSPDGKPSELTMRYNYKLEGKEMPFVPAERQRARVQLDLPGSVEVSAAPMRIDTVVSDSK